MKLHIVWIVLIVFTLTIIPEASMGDDTYWQTGTGDWFVDGHWTMGVPQAGDRAYVDNSGTAEIGAGNAEAK